MLAALIPLLVASLLPISVSSTQHSVMKQASFCSHPNIQLNGGSRKDGETDSLMLVGPQNARASLKGSAFLKTPVNVLDGFTVLFTFSLQWVQDPGGEGLALVIQSNDEFALGSAYGGIGYAGILGGIALEFDVQQNNGNKTMANHVSLHVAAKSVPLSSVEDNADDIRKELKTSLRDGEMHTANVTYLPPTSSKESSTGVLWLLLDDAEIFSWPLDLTSYFQSNAFVGFTSSSAFPGALTRIHRWSIYQDNSSTSCLPGFDSDHDCYPFTSGGFQQEEAEACSLLSSSCSKCQLQSSYCCQWTWKNTTSSSKKLADDGSDVGGSCGVLSERNSHTLALLSSCNLPGPAPLPPLATQQTNAGEENQGKKGKNLVFDLEIGLTVLLTTGIVVTLLIYIRWTQLDAHEKLFFFDSCSHFLFTCFRGLCCESDVDNTLDQSVDETERVPCFSYVKGLCGYFTQRNKHRYKLSQTEERDLESDQPKRELEMEGIDAAERINLMQINEQLEFT